MGCFLGAFNREERGEGSAKNAKEVYLFLCFSLLLFLCASLALFAVKP
jgi:hypothetical protein